MLKSFRKRWRAFRNAPPGQRFERRYENRRRERGDKSFASVLYVVAGVLLLLAGLFFMAVPGPGIPIFLVGAGLIAGESLRVARWLDRLELWLRRVWARKKSAST